MANKKYDPSKIILELDKIDDDSLFREFSSIKNYFASRLEKVQKQADEKANTIQNQLDQINRVQ